MAVNDRRYRRAEWGTAWCMAGRLPALQAGAGGKRRDGEPVPYGGKRPEFVIASQCAHWRGNPFPPSPFPMFSNRNLKTPTFSFFNFQFSIPASPAIGCMWRSMTAATVGCGVRRAVSDRPYERV